jgi:hypothetical protein
MCPCSLANNLRVQTAAACSAEIRKRRIVTAYRGAVPAARPSRRPSQGHCTLINHAVSAGEEHHPQEFPTVAITDRPSSRSVSHGGYYWSATVSICCQHDHVMFEPQILLVQFDLRHHRCRPPGRTSPRWEPTRWSRSSRIVIWPCDAKGSRSMSYAIAEPSRCHRQVLSDLLVVVEFNYCSTPAVAGEPFITHRPVSSVPFFLLTHASPFFCAVSGCCCHRVKQLPPAALLIKLHPLPKANHKPCKPPTRKACVVSYVLKTSYISILCAWMSYVCSYAQSKFLCPIILLSKWLDDIMLTLCLSNNDSVYLKLHSRTISMQCD